MRQIRFCKYCGQELNEKSKFCPQCGREIIKKTEESEEKKVYGDLSAEKLNEKTVHSERTIEKKKIESSKSHNTKMDLNNIKEDFSKNVKKGIKNVNFSSSSFYILDLFKRFTDPKNIPIAIYMFLNLLIIGCVFAFPAASSGDRVVAIRAFGDAMLLYLLSLVIALSPIGEFILRIQSGCTKIKRNEQIDCIEPLFQEVYEKAKLEDPSLSDDVKLFIKSESSANAFATGRKTICITEGLLDCPDEQIKATLAHEFGHLAHKDTDLILLVGVGNIMVTILLLFIRIMIGLMHLFFGLGALIAGKDGFWGTIANFFASILTAIFITAFEWVWTKLGILLVMKSSQDNEYGADDFARRLGYGNALCELLDSFECTMEKGLFANLASSHPNKDLRIAKLQAKGCTYAVNYRKH